MSKTHEPASDFCAAARRSSGRVHLPVAPRAMARIRFSAEKPLPRALTPEQALNWLDYLIEQGQTIKAVNVGGPGDPMATPELTLEVLAMLRAKLPGVSLCLTTLGLGLTALADRLAALDLAHLAMLVDAVDPLVAAKVYAWIRPGVRTIPPGPGGRPAHRPTGGGHHRPQGQGSAGHRQDHGLPRRQRGARGAHRRHGRPAGRDGA